MHGTEYSVSGVIRTCKETYQFCLLFMFIEGVHKGKTVDAFFSHRCYVVLALSHDRIEKNSQFYRIIDDLVTHTLPRQQKRNPSLLIVISHQQKPMEFNVKRQFESSNQRLRSLRTKQNKHIYGNNEVLTETSRLTGPSFSGKSTGAL